jgi:hypothetical protein
VLRAQGEHKLGLALPTTPPPGPKTAALATKEKKKRVYMVCTGNYVATNTRQQKRAILKDAFGTVYDLPFGQW